MRFAQPLLIAVAIAAVSAAADARVVRVQILSRDAITGTFGGHAYERITGRVYFAFDPHNPENRKIVDLALAPRNRNGEVEATSDFVMLRPADIHNTTDVGVIDIVNRGGMTTFIFNLERDPRAPVA